MAKTPLPVPLTGGTVAIPAGGQTYVYRAYCRCGDLLYVGITSDLFRRFAAHARQRAPWELKLVRVAWDLYATRDQAERVETHLIATLHPIHNVQGRAGRVPRWTPLPKLKPPPSRQESAFTAHRALALGDRF